MKSLKFMPHLVPKILAGEKTSTWRLFDDKDLAEGDEFIMINRETGEEFAKGKITNVRERPLGDMTEGDLKTHEKFKDQNEMLATYRNYYGDQVSLGTLVKITDFELL